MPMSTDDAHRMRWTLIRPEAEIGTFVASNGICEYFVGHPELGSPLSAEDDWSDVEGGRIQVFTSGVVGWDADAGARLVTW